MPAPRLLIVCASFCFPSLVAASDTLFEFSIRPVLAEKCVKCHGTQAQQGGVRLDAAAYLDADALQRLVSEQSTAPAVCQLDRIQRSQFRAWIEAGLPWPASTEGFSEDGDEPHWAFDPVRRPAVPVSDHDDWIRTPVDAFVLQKLIAAQLTPSPEADRRTLIRRLAYTVTGLPPTPEEVDHFVHDSDAGAYERLVDRLLKSPRYGEHWARHWLDVARYSDTKGYVYGREERFWTHAWAYRDWVVEAFNQDLPYDRFLLLQLAADQVVAEGDPDLAAMGFLTLGRRFQGIERDIIDDRIDVVTRGTLALTVSCARCHDHMYDPIPTDDYYSLYGIFASSQEALVSVGDLEAGGQDFQQELKKRRDAVLSRFKVLREEASQRARERLPDYLYAQTELHKYPPSGFDQIFSKQDLLPAFVHRWADYLRQAEQRSDPIFLPWVTYAKLEADHFAAQAASVRFDESKLHPLVAAQFRSPPQTLREVANRYGKVFADLDGRGAEELRELLHGPQAIAAVPDLPVVHSQWFFDTDSTTELYKLEGEVARWINKPGVEAPQALILRDRQHPVMQRVFLRGNPVTRGEEVPRQFPAILAGKDREPFRTGSGRLELAKSIISPHNPLTARVIVNRVWGHHFGRGLVDTPSDFGLRSSPPSHPELLDWLASRLVDDGWSLKKLHRILLLSATFRQSSFGQTDGSVRATAVALDPDNRLLSRMNSRRLSWEQFRDSMLAAAGELDLKSGGRPVNLFAQPFPKRRTLYGLVDRQFLPSLLRTFDFANPDLHIPKRAETTVPQQALFFMNDPLVLDRARALARFAREQSDSPHEQLTALFKQALQRAPTRLEQDEALGFTERLSVAAVPSAPNTAQDWQYGLGMYDESAQQITGFANLPHFTGKAWQGGPQYPDSGLGWVQLTATGGHPGNTRQHGSVRRWTAPRKTTIQIASRLVHEPGVSDGIRAFIVSSRSGLLATVSIKQQSVSLDVESVEVEPGETIDFVVDIGNELNNDQYLWSATLTESTGSGLTWNSQLDFTPKSVNQLDAWEQLAQALLCSNEFLFVD